VGLLVPYGGASTLGDKTQGNSLSNPHLRLVAERRSARGRWRRVGARACTRDGHGLQWRRWAIWWGVGILVGPSYLAGGGKGRSAPHTRQSHIGRARRAGGWGARPWPVPRSTWRVSVVVEESSWRSRRQVVSRWRGVRIKVRARRRGGRASDRGHREGALDTRFPGEEPHQGVADTPWGDGRLTGSGATGE
jgi:hypothetical protein